VTRRWSRIRVCALFAALLIAGCATAPAPENLSTSSRKVLVIAWATPTDVDFAATRELNLIIDMISAAGFTPVVASESGSPFRGPTRTSNPDLELSDVRAGEYAGFLLPCMVAAGNAAAIPSDILRIVRQAAGARKPIAALDDSVRILSRAGLLKGRTYASALPEFPEGTYGGNGVVQDGNIMTGAVCSDRARSTGLPDGTRELTCLLIQLLSILGQDVSAFQSGSGDAFDKMLLRGKENDH
jgi:putative intracellular protease/amidase